MRRISILVAAVAILLLGAAAALAGNIWNGYHWADESADPHDGSISLTLVDHIDAVKYGTVFAAVFGDWDQTVNEGNGPLTLEAVTAARPVACGGIATDGAGDAIYGTIHVCNDAYGVNGWLGLARIWLDGAGHIDAGVALLNDSYLLGSSTTYNNENAWRHVLCQEIGHTFGLDHQGSPRKQTCMNDRWGLTSSNFVSPNQHDYDMLNEIYGLTSSDGEEGGKTKPCNPNRKNCPAPGANVHITPRPGGGWIITYTTPPVTGLIPPVTGLG